jgi:hypothetical protein
MQPTSEQIELMDKVFDDFINHFSFNNKTDLYFDPTNIRDISEKYHISKDKAQFILNEIYQIGHNEKLLVAYKGSFGDYDLVQSLNIILCENFKYHGGFKKYFSDINKDLSFEQNIKIDNNYGQVVNAGGQSELSNFDMNLESHTPKLTPLKNVKNNAIYIAILWLWGLISQNPLISTIIGGIILAIILKHFKVI